MTDSRTSSTKRALWHDYSKPGWYHLTFYTHGHREIFGVHESDGTESMQHTEILNEVLSTVTEHYPCARIDTSRIRPTQLDLLIELLGHRNPVEEPCGDYATWRSFRRTMTISLVSGFVKMNSGYQINHLRGSQGKPVWRERYSDRFLNDEQSVNEVRAMLRDTTDLVDTRASMPGGHDVESGFASSLNEKGTLCATESSYRTEPLPEMPHEAKRDAGRQTRNFIPGNRSILEEQGVPNGLSLGVCARKLLMMVVIARIGGGSGGYASGLGCTPSVAYQYVGPVSSRWSMTCSVSPAWDVGVGEP